MRISHRRSSFPNHYITPLPERPPVSMSFVPATEQPITTDLTPGQTLALLKLRDTDLTNAVRVKLQNGSARPLLQDYADLVPLGLAICKADGFHRLTPHGHFKASMLARALADQLGITRVQPAPNRRTSFRPGCMSQNGNW